MWYFLVALAIYCICGAIHFYDYYQDTEIGVKFFAPMDVMAIVVLFIPGLLYGIFRNVIFPTTFEHLVNVKKVNPFHWHDYGYWGWCYDSNARHIYHRFFLYRIKKGW